jgi:hypothetical protein
MDNSEQIAIELTYLPENISLTLCGCSVSEWICHHVEIAFDYKGSQSVDYESQQANHYPIELLTCPKVIDAALTLIVKTRLFSFQFLIRL